MRHLKYFESYRDNDHYVELPHGSVDEVLFDDWLDITDVAFKFKNDEIELIVNSFKNFKFIEKYPDLEFKVTTKTRQRLGGLVTLQSIDLGHSGDDIVQICINIINNLHPDNDLTLMIYKVSDEWYYVATSGGDGDYKCDQVEGLLKFFEDLPKISDIYKGISVEKLDESVSEISTKEKLESIVSMCEYLWSINAADSLRGFYGDCSALFAGCLDINNGWSSNNGMMPYDFNIDCLVARLSKTVREDKIKLMNELYELSKSKRFKYKIEDIKRIFKPVTDFKVLGNTPIEKIEVSQYYDWLAIPSFSVDFFIAEDELSYDRAKIQRNYKDVNFKDELKSASKEFHHIKKITKDIIEKIDLKSLGLDIEYKGDYTYLGDFEYFIVGLKEI